MIKAEFQKVPKHVLDDYNAGAVKDILHWILLDIGQDTDPVQFSATTFKNHLQNGFRHFLSNLECGNTCKPVKDRQEFEKVITQLFKDDGYQDQNDIIKKKMIHISSLKLVITLNFLKKYP